MSLQDPLSDLFSRIRNAQMRYKPIVSSPVSKLRENILEVLKKEGYIRGYARTKHSSGREELDIELKYDEKGNVKGEVKGSGRILAGMIQQRNQNIQKKYKIAKPVFLDVPKHQDFGKMKSKFLGRLQKLQNKYGLQDNDTLGLYHQKWWESFILKKKKDVSLKVLEGLVRRWAFFEKKYSVAMMKKDIEDEKFLEWVLKFDKQNHSKQVKENMKPFETLFFEVGAEILKNVKGFIAANPDKAVQGIKKKLDAAIKDVRAGGDLKKLNRLKVQLDRLNAIGGLDSIVPSEGIVFKYKGNTYKFTGAFAPINQITGLITF